MDYSLLIEYLGQKQCITDLEKDILSTWNELWKNPFDRNSAQMKVIQNNVKYPDVFVTVKALSTTIIQPFDYATDADICYNLKEQFKALAAKAGLPNDNRIR